MRVYQFALFGLAALCLIAGPGRAQDGELALPAERLSEAPQITGVIELFTSQGCSSCPPADTLLKSYTDRKDVIALSFPVDIWDYLGWKDTLASPRNSERQRTYAKTRGDGAVYTPQAVINGMAHVNGGNRSQIDAALARTSESLANLRIPIRFSNNRNVLVIETGVAPPGVDLKEAVIWVALIQKSATIEIPEGENKGKTITYTNVVREMTPVGMWTGQPMLLKLARTAIMRPETEACVVILQQGKAGPILGAAWTGLW